MTTNSRNPAKGHDFEQTVGEYLRRHQGLRVVANYEVEVSINGRLKKLHKFDWGNRNLVVECKSYDWTAGGNNPSAKLATANEAMLYFLGVPQSFRKMLFMPTTAKRGKVNPNTLVEYYVRMYGHFIPEDVEVYELNANGSSSEQIWPPASR